jgi:hypothetical protein
MRQGQSRHRPRPHRRDQSRQKPQTGRSLIIILAQDIRSARCGLAIILGSDMKGDQNAMKQFGGQFAQRQLHPALICAKRACAASNFIARAEVSASVEAISACNKGETTGSTPSRSARRCVICHSSARA